MSYQNLGQIYRNLYNDAFDDVICKPRPSVSGKKMFLTKSTDPICIRLSPSLNGLGEGELPPNLPVSPQLMMKLGKDVLWAKIFLNRQKMTTLS